MTNHWTAAGAPRASITPLGSRLFVRMTLPMIISGTVLLTLGVLGAWQVHRLQQRGADMISGNVASIRAAEGFETVAQEMRYRLKRYLSTGNERHLDQIASLLPEGRHWIGETWSLANTGRERQLLQRVERGYSGIQANFGELAHDAQSEASRALAAYIADEIIPNEILTYTQDLVELHEQELDRNSRRNEALANRLMFALLMLGTCGGVAGLLAGYGIARRVNRAIVQLSVPIRDTAGKLGEVVGPISVSAEPGFDDLESVLQSLSQRVAVVVERLQESERDMLRAEQLAAVGQLAAGLAHELRNPLTSVKTILQLAETPAELTARDLVVLQEEIGRLEQSVRTFLDFARPPQPEKRRMDLGELLRQTMELVERRAQRQAVRLELRSRAETLPAHADGTQLRQVVLNMILNALDVAPRDSTVAVEADVAAPPASVREHSGVDDPAAPWAVIRVADRGPGLPVQLGERIFDPFISTKETGLGLGLSISRRIVDAHGGALVASDAVEGGAVFSVWLPLADMGAGAAASAAKSPEPAPSAGAGHHL